MQDIRSCFTTGFGSGSLIEVDFSQLEVYCLAFKADCAKLLQELSDGEDLHTRNASWLFGVDKADVTPDQRRKGKEVSFMLQYGAGAKTISERTGLDIDLCRSFIDRYNYYYPEIKRYAKTVAAGCMYHEKENVFTYKEALTGKTYTFNVDTPTYRRLPVGPPQPNHTQVANYPIQGFGADIMHLVLCELGKVLIGHEKIKIVNCIHDSVLFDVCDDSTSDALSIICDVFDAVGRKWAEMYGTTIPFKFPYEIKQGRSWDVMTCIFSKRESSL